MCQTEVWANNTQGADLTEIGKCIKATPSLTYCVPLTYTMLQVNYISIKVTFLKKGK